MELYDLVIVGGGPAGLSAAINGRSELRKVLLIDSGRKENGGYVRELGGQALGSTLIENYAGFPQGISGCDLMALFEEHANKFETEIVCPEHVDSLKLGDKEFKQLTTREGREVLAKSVILSNGLSYKMLSAPGIDDLLGKGVLYGAPTSSAHALGACTVCVVGGANSAGQAVMHLSQNPDCKIKILIRGNKPLQDTMSQYLIDRINKCPNVEVVQDVEVQEAYGNGVLTGLLLKRGSDQALFHYPADHLFIFIGATPKTKWLDGAVMMDKNNFIATGDTLGTFCGPRLPFETSMPGVFAAGDIRLSLTKRVAAAAGEGAMAVSFVHQYLSARAARL